MVNPKNAKPAVRQIDVRLLDGRILKVQVNAETMALQVRDHIAGQLGVQAKEFFQMWIESQGKDKAQHFPLNHRALIGHMIDMALREWNLQEQPRLCFRAASIRNVADEAKITDEVSLNLLRCEGEQDVLAGHIPTNEAQAMHFGASHMFAMVRPDLTEKEVEKEFKKNVASYLPEHMIENIKPKVLLPQFCEAYKALTGTPKDVSMTVLSELRQRLYYGSVFIKAIAKVDDEIVEVYIGVNAQGLHVLRRKAKSEEESYLWSHSFDTSKISSAMGGKGKVLVLQVRQPKPGKKLKGEGEAEAEEPAKETEEKEENLEGSETSEHKSETGEEGEDDEEEVDENEEVFMYNLRRNHGLLLKNIVNNHVMIRDAQRRQRKESELKDTNINLKEEVQVLTDNMQDLSQTIEKLKAQLDERQEEISLLMGEKEELERFREERIEADRIREEEEEQRRLEEEEERKRKEEEEEQKRKEEEEEKKKKEEEEQKGKKPATPAGSARKPTTRAAGSTGTPTRRTSTPASRTAAPGARTPRTTTTRSSASSAPLSRSGSSSSFVDMPIAKSRSSGMARSSSTLSNSSSGGAGAKDSAQLRAKFEKLQKELEALKAKHAQLTKEHQETKGKLSQAGKDAAQGQGKASKMEAKLAALEKSESQAKQQVTDLKAELKTLKKAKDQAEASAASSGTASASELKQAEQKAIQLGKKLEDTEKKLSVQQENAQKLKEAVESQKEEIRELKKKVSDLTMANNSNEKASMQAEQAVKKEKEKAEKQTQALEQQHRNEMETLKKEMEKAKAALTSQMSKAGDDSEKKEKKLKDQVATAEAKITDLTAQMEELKIKNQEEAQKGASETKTLKGKLKKAEDDIALLNSKLEKSEAAAEATKNELEQAQARAKEVDAELKEKSRRLKELEEVSQDTAKLKAEYDEMKREVVGLKDDNERLLKAYKDESRLRKKYFNEMEDMKGKIRVYCRVRPLSNSEKQMGSQSIVDQPDEYTLVVKASEEVSDRAAKQVDKQFEYDQSFQPLCSQDQVFEDTKHVVQSAIDGYNVCVFAFGQTGSGKTYTMTGEEGNPGITPRAINTLFEIIDRDKDILDVKLSCYMVELYNDNLCDLLCPDKKNPPKLDIVKDKNTNLVQVAGAEIIPVTCASELTSKFNEGLSSRKVASTLMNADSSRSHLVFSVLLETFNKETQTTLFGKISFIDLAGSERVSKSGAINDSERLKEASSINRSLSALNDVIVACSNQDKHIPYRNNKLTQIMADSIGGNAKTLMFCNISPAEYNRDETLLSLSYASRVKTITNDSSKNLETREIARLKKMIQQLKEKGGVEE
eukprot:GCRY01002062.1.p1 GENE.GCRY01002062.1~~GCRY01002062.1.p1  ORF type:complete len:1326 (+),score=511.11 GCRY01002062.1:180-4157(+)